MEERRLVVFVNRVLRRICGLKRDEVTGEWRKLYKEELNYLYSSHNTFQIEKSEMGGACSTMREVYTGFWWENLRERDHLEDPGVDGRTILRWVFRKWDREHGLDRSGSG